MPFFTPPSALSNPPFLPDSTPTQVALFRHTSPKPVGVNVFLLADGTFVQDYPTPENSNTNVPYPIFLDRSTPLSYVTNSDLSVTEVFVQNPVVKIYYGSHTVEVSAAEAAALTAAGYGSQIS